MLKHATLCLAAALAMLAATPAAAITRSVSTTVEQASFFDNGGSINIGVTVAPFWTRVTSVRLDYIGDLGASNENIAVAYSGITTGLLANGSTLDNGAWSTASGDPGSDFGLQYTAFMSPVGLDAMNAQLAFTGIRTFLFTFTGSSATDLFSPNNVNVDPFAQLSLYGFGQFTGGAYAPAFAVRLRVTGDAVPLPAAAPLLASAVAGLGLLGWRRRRSR